MNHDYAQDEERYATLPSGSIVADDHEPCFMKTIHGTWVTWDGSGKNQHHYTNHDMASSTRHIYRVGWED